MPFYGSVYGLMQGRWPRLCSLCVNVAEVEAHDYEALEPQSRLIEKLSDVPLDLVVAAMVYGLHIVGLAGNNALVTMQVSFSS